MRYIITESRLQDIFDKYMDSQYGLTYNSKEREFRTDGGNIFGDLWGDNRFGDMWEQKFYYAYRSEEELLKSMFGDATNKLLLTYLRSKFPDIKIYEVV